MKMLLFEYDSNYNEDTIKSLMYTKKGKLHINTQWHEICYLYSNFYDIGQIRHLDDRYDIL